MNIQCKVIELSPKRKNYARVSFSLGSSKIAMTKFGWGWLKEDATVGETFELPLDEFAKITFGEGTNEKGTYKTFEMGV